MANRNPGNGSAPKRLPGTSKSVDRGLFVTETRVFKHLDKPAANNETGAVHPPSIHPPKGNAAKKKGF